MKLRSIVHLPLLTLATAMLLGADRASTTPAGELMLNRDVENPSPVLSLREIKPSSISRWMEVTAYCPCQKCCGPDAAGITASGLPVSHNQGRFVAADTSILPFGSQLIIPGYHSAAKVPVIDRGGAIKGDKIDVFYPTHQEAREWGRRWVMVTIVSE